MPFILFTKTMESKPYNLAEFSQFANLNEDVSTLVESLRPNPVPDDFYSLSFEQQKRVQIHQARLRLNDLIEKKNIFIPSLKSLKQLEYYPVECEGNNLYLLQLQIVQAMKDERLSIGLTSAITGRERVTRLKPEDIQTYPVVVDVIEEAIHLLKSERKDRVNKYGSHFPETVIQCEQMYELEDGQKSLLDMKVMKSFDRRPDKGHKSRVLVNIFLHKEEQ